MLAVFARANHPAGYASSGKDAKGQDTLTGAHGYVVLIVQCRDLDQLHEVAIHLGRYVMNGIPWEWPGRHDGWYGGQFDLLWAQEAERPQMSLSDHDYAIHAPHPTITGYAPSLFEFKLGEYTSIGDNRAVAYLTAEEVLANEGHRWS